MRNKKMMRSAAFFSEKPLMIPMAHLERSMKIRKNICEDGFPDPSDGTAIYPDGSGERPEAKLQALTDTGLLFSE